MSASEFLRWSEFESAESGLAGHGSRLLTQFGIGLAFLATTRADGGPRLHPVCPVIAEGGLWVFVMGASPKRRDLERDGRYAMHTFLGESDDESFFVSGNARRIEPGDLRTRLEGAVKHHVQPTEVLFEFSCERALHTTWIEPHTPQTRPVYTRWRADR